MYSMMGMVSVTYNYPMVGYLIVNRSAVFTVNIFTSWNSMTQSNYKSKVIFKLVCWFCTVQHINCLTDLPFANRSEMKLEKINWCKKRGSYSRRSDWCLSGSFRRERWRRGRCMWPDRPSLCSELTAWSRRSGRSSRTEHDSENQETLK